MKSLNRTPRHLSRKVRLQNAQTHKVAKGRDATLCAGCYHMGHRHVIDHRLTSCGVCGH